MPAGIEVYNDFGTLHLSHNLYNPVLRAQGTATVTAGQATIAYNRADATDQPLCVVKPGTGVSFISVIDSGLTRTWHISSLDSTLDYFIFGRPGSPSGSFGLEVYDASGNLNFSIQNKPLRIRDNIVGPIMSSDDFVYDAGREYGVSLNRWSMRAIYRSLPDDTREEAIVVSEITDGLRVAWELFQVSAGDNSTLQWADIQLLAVDLTDY